MKAEETTGTIPENTAISYDTGVVPDGAAASAAPGTDGYLPDPAAAEEPEEPVEKKKLPLASKILFGFAALSGVIYAAACLSRPFADFFCRYVASGVRWALAKITELLPFSLGEACVLLLLPAFVYTVAFVLKKYSGSWRNVGVFALTMLSVVSLLFSLFVFTLGTGYRGSTLDEKLEIGRKNVSVEELKDTASKLAGLVAAEADGLYYGSDGFSVMPFGYSGMSDELMEAYGRLCEKYGFVQNFYSRIKTVMLSEPWTYTHITGVYTYFTGESNLNTNMPDYTLPFTAAHEFAHQRGISREDEANFVAYLACIESDDPYVRYSGYLNLYEYVASALYSADHDAYFEVSGKLPAEVRAEMSAYNRFFEKYRHNVAATVSGAVNDTYLKSQGTPGEKSYGMVVDLAVAYYKVH